MSTGKTWRAHLVNATTPGQMKHHSLAESSNIVGVVHIESRPYRIMRRVIRPREPAFGVGMILDVALSERCRFFGGYVVQNGHVLSGKARC
jgi:hypothetical protein